MVKTAIGATPEIVLTSTDHRLINYKPDKLEHLSQESNNKYGDLLTRLAQSMILKSSKRTMHKVDAQRLLQSIISEDIIDHRLTLFAMIND